MLHIEDVDLWKFKLPHTKELMSALALAVLILRSGIKSPLIGKILKVEKYIKEGEIILKYEQKSLSDY